MIDPNAIRTRASDPLPTRGRHEKPTPGKDRKSLVPVHFLLSSQAGLSLRSSFEQDADISASPCTGSAKSMPLGVLVSRTGIILVREFVRRGEKVENRMRHIALICATVALGIFVSPAFGQQAPPEQTPPPAQQTGPNEPAPPTEQSMPEETQPPSTPQTEPLPPPFPPMPRARPSHRWVDLGNEHRSRSHRHTSRTHHHRAKAHRPALHASSRMIRKCHSMSHRQAMRQSLCRSLMQHHHHPGAQRHHTMAHRHHPAERRPHGAMQHRHRHSAKSRRT